MLSHVPFKHNYPILCNEMGIQNITYVKGRIARFALLNKFALGTTHLNCYPL